MSQNISSNSKDGVLYLTVNIDEMKESTDCYSIRDEMKDAQQAAGTEKILIDMAKVTFMGSVGILAFLGLRRNLDDLQGQIVFYNLSEQIKGMLSTCKLISDDPHWSSPFQYADSEDAAIAKIK